MSLQAFHKVFIAAALVCCAVTARWASGHNAAALVTPWARNSAIAGMILLAPYFVWRLKRS